MKDRPTLIAARALVAALEAEEPKPATLTETDVYYTRSTAPEGARGRTWDAAVRDLIPEGKVFRPGRECLIRRVDFHAWIEAHPVARENEPAARESVDVVDFADFKKTALRGGRR
jgi:hypothetical protein